MTVKPKYYFNLDGNISNGKKEYSLHNIEDVDSLLDLLNELYEENKQLKLQNEELLYQIGYVGKNNKSCDGCECFLEDIGYCWMWDMNVKKEDIVVACDQRKVKNIKEIMSND